MNTIEMPLRGDADVNEVNAIGNIWFLICTSSTQEPRCSCLKLFSIILVYTSSCLCHLFSLAVSCKFCRTLWILLKNDARIFQGNTYGPIQVAAFWNTCFNQSSATTIPCKKISCCDKDTLLSVQTVQHVSVLFFLLADLLKNNSICDSSGGVQLKSKDSNCGYTASYFSEQSIFCFRGQVTSKESIDEKGRW